MSHDRKAQKKLAAKKARRADVRAEHLGIRAVVRASTVQAARRPSGNTFTRRSLGIDGRKAAPTDATDSLLNMDLSAMAEKIGVVAESVSEDSGELYGSEPPAVA